MTVDNKTFCEDDDCEINDFNVNDKGILINGHRRTKKQLDKMHKEAFKNRTHVWSRNSY